MNCTGGGENNVYLGDRISFSDGKEWHFLLMAASGMAVDCTHANRDKTLRIGLANVHEIASATGKSANNWCMRAGELFESGNIPCVTKGVFSL